MPQKVNAIENGFEILKMLATQETGHGVTAIAKQTGISPSSCLDVSMNITLVAKTTPEQG